MLDGNRRWARARGAETADGHQAGADKIEHLLDWCDEVGVEVVTLWLLSTDNLSRPRAELGPLLRIIEEHGRRDLAATQALAAAPGRAPSTCCRPRPPSRLKARGRRHRATSRAASSTSRSATADGARSPTRCARCCTSTPRRGTSIEELAEVLDVEHIAEHLYTKGQPDPDLVIRTSGEQRLVGLPALAERAQRVLLLRGLLAGLPQGRLPARAARLRRARAAASAPERRSPARPRRVRPRTPRAYTRHARLARHPGPDVPSA